MPVGKTTLGPLLDAEDAEEFTAWMRTSDDVCDLFEHVTGATLTKKTPLPDVIDFIYAIAEALDESV